MQEQDREQEGQFADTEQSGMESEQLEQGDSRQQEKPQASGSGRGLASMSQERRRAIASKGGQSQGKDNNPGNFANNREKAAAAGAKGGANSHGGGRQSSDE